MILSHKNKDGYIYSYFEWDVVDNSGVQKNNGEYMHVRHLWVHTSFNGSDEIHRYIAELDIDERNQNIKWIYWAREKQGYTDRPSKLFSRDNCLRKAGKYVKSFTRILERNCR